MKDSASEKLELKCGCPPPARNNATIPVVKNLDVSSGQTETNGTGTGPIVNTFEDSKNYALAGTMNSASLHPCDEGGFSGNSWNDDRVNCPKEHQEARCLFLWNNGVTAKVTEAEKEDEEVQVKEDSEETSSVHFFLEQLVSDEGWRECVEVKILSPIIVSEKKNFWRQVNFCFNFQMHFLLKLSGALLIKTFRCTFLLKLSGAQPLGRVEDQTFRTN